MRKAKTKALCVSILVIVTFLICWAPYYCSVLYYIVMSRSDGSDSSVYHGHIFQVIFFFGMSNSVLNPIVYGAFHMAHRSKLAWQNWRKWNRRSYPPPSGGSQYILPDPDSFSLIFSPLMRVNTLSSSYTTCKASPKLKRPSTKRATTAAQAAHTPSLDI